MKKLLGAFAAIVLALLLFSPPAEARCWGHGHRWHCTHHRHHYWHAWHRWRPYPYPYLSYRAYYPRYSYSVF